MPAPTVSVVVPVRDAPDALALLVAALAAQRGAPPFELVVADDGSLRDLAPALAGAPFPVCTVRLDPSRGPGSARNAALDVARGALVAFTDADCRPAPDWLAALCAPLASGACIAQGPIRVPDGADVGPFDRSVQRPAPGGLHETANLGARLVDLRAVGGLPRGVRPLGGKELGEDVGLGCALRRHGLPVAWCPDAVVRHPVEARGWRGAARERLRAGGFCVLVRRWPELRATALHRRAFLGPHRPALDAALLATAAAIGVARAPERLRRPVRVAAALATVPYLRALRARSWGVDRHRRPAIAAGLLAGDIAETAGLAAGALRTRTPVL